MVEGINTIKNNQNGNFEAGQSLGNTLRGFGSTLADGAASVFRGVGGFANAVSNPLIQAGAQFSALQPPVVFSWGWGPCFWGPFGLPGIGINGYPMYFGPVAGLSFPELSSSIGTTGGCTCNCGGSGGNTTVSGGNSFSGSSALAAANAATDISGINTNINTPQSYVPIYNPDSITDAFRSIDRTLNPGKYNMDGTPKANSTTTDPKDKALELIDPNTGKASTPMWYRELATKKEQGKALSKEENHWYQQYNRLYRTYSPYQLDENLDYKLDSSGQKIETNIAGELLELQHLFAGKRRDEIEAYINSCSAEKLAALELHYPKMEFSGGKSLRDAIKESCIASWLEWTGWNTDRCQRIFDKMDEAATMSPTNMKNALYQALENHRMGGFGFDEARLNKLLAKLEEDKLLRAYVRKEYPGLITDIGKKWFKDEETENRLRKIFT